MAVVYLETLELEIDVGVVKADVGVVQPAQLQDHICDCSNHWKQKYRPSSKTALPRWHDTWPVVQELQLPANLVA